MPLQTSITTQMDAFTAGQLYTGAGQANTTKSLTITTAFTAPGTTDLYGRFVMYTTTSALECQIISGSTPTRVQIAGVVLNSKDNQNAPANLGGTSYINEGDMLAVITQGWVVVRTNGTFDPLGDLYINLGTSSTSGSLQNSSTNGLLVGGPSFAYGTGNFATPTVRGVRIGANNLALVQLMFN
jgi:hypothetical protein